MNIAQNALPGVVLTLPELYRRNAPEYSAELYNGWVKVLKNLFVGDTVYLSDLVCTIEEYSKAINSLEKHGCNVLIILPLAYSPSGVAVKALSEKQLPIILVSTSRDHTLNYDIGGKDLLANQAMHGVQDISNGLWRNNIPHLIMAGHPQRDNFKEKLSSYINIAYSAFKMRHARIGQLGGFFPQMMDFTFDKELQERKLGYSIVEITVGTFLGFVQEVTESEIVQYMHWMKTHFQISPDFTQEELESAARYSIAYHKITHQYQLDGMGMNFQDVIREGGNNLPFIGIDRSMQDGIGYAGEGDVQTAALMSALLEICPDTSFVEMFCPDYTRNEILLSHMGESNIRLANTDHVVKVKPRVFAWGKCSRLAVPVFQLRPGLATLVSLTEEPSSHDFRVISSIVNVLDAPEHFNLENPHSRIRIDVPLEDFIETYSDAGGPHHLCLLFGDWRQEIRLFAKALGLNHIVVPTGVDA